MRDLILDPAVRIHRRARVREVLTAIHQAMIRAELQAAHLTRAAAARRAIQAIASTRGHRLEFLPSVVQQQQQQ
jgi:hypothetical protein